MAGYFIESQFILLDKASPALKTLIGNIDKASLALTEFNKLIGTTSKMLAEFGLSGKTVADTFTPLNTVLGTSNKQFDTMTATTSAASRGLTKMAVASKEAQLSLANVNRQLKANTELAAVSGRVGGGGMFGFFGGLPGKILGAGLMGMIGMDVAKSALKPGMEYDQVLHRMNDYMLSEQEKNRAITAAQQISRTMPLTTPTTNLKGILDIYGITKDIPDAIQKLQINERVRAVMLAAAPHLPNFQGEDQLNQTFAKIAEMTGRMGAKDYERLMGGFQRAMIAHGGMINPQSYMQTIKMMRGARYGKSDEWLMGELPYFIAEMSGGSGGGGNRGAGPLIGALDQLFGVGVMSKGMMGVMHKHGLLDISKGDWAKVEKHMNTTAIKQILNAGMAGRELFTTDPFQWMWDPRYGKKMLLGENQRKIPGATEEEQMANFKKLPQAQQRMAVLKAFPGLTRLQGDVISQLYIMEDLIKRSRDLWRQVAPLQDAYNEAMRTQAIQVGIAQTAVKDFFIALGANPVVKGFVTHSLEIFTNAVSKLTGVISDPNLAKSFPNIITGLKDVSKMLSEMGMVAGVVAKELAPLMPVLEWLTGKGLSLLRYMWEGSPLMQAAKIGNATQDFTQGKMGAGAYSKKVSDIMSGQDMFNKGSGLIPSAPKQDAIWKYDQKGNVIPNQSSTTSPAATTKPIHRDTSNFNWSAAIANAKTRSQSPVNVHAPVTVNIHGPIEKPHVDKIKKAMDDHAKKLTEIAMVFAGTVGPSGGNLTNPAYAGGYYGSNS